ncbi:MAG: glycosyl hydrolase family 79 C-terminal domain-containing protein [Rhizonema sp. NSF051]|nr:glycosyl hydrolase family 79 C-terminal domain-containing protein [Rhizonema sp. NSF051]
MNQSQHPNRRDFLIGCAGLAGASLINVLKESSVKADDNSSQEIQISVDFNQPGRFIPSDFTGLSYEASTLPNSTVFNSDNKIFLNFVRQLGKRGILRIGGNSVEKTFWKGGKRTSQTDKTSITEDDLDSLFDFAGKAGWKVMLGLNLGQSTPEVAASEAEYAARIAKNQLLSIEVGNEPDLYYKNGLRSSTYQYSDFLQEFTTYFDTIRDSVPNVPFSGPTTASATDTWVVPFAKDAASRIILLTQHYYRMGPPQNSDVTINRLLSPDNNIVKIAQKIQTAAQQNNLPYRIAECNSVYQGGKQGVSNVFASALWGVDFMFTLAQNGAAGINFHGGAAGIYTPIAVSQGEYSARPLYYGMLLFKLGSRGRLLPVTVSQNSVNLTVYAVLSDNDHVLLTVINKDSSQDATLAIDLGCQLTRGSVLRLTSPSLDSTSDITLGGSSVKSDASWQSHTQEQAQISENIASVEVPAASAALVTLH